MIVVNPLPDPNLLEIVMTEILYTETGEFAVGYQIAYNSGVGGPLLHIPNQVIVLLKIICFNNRLWELCDLWIKGTKL